jgi:hypothetical protein
MGQASGSPYHTNRRRVDMAVDRIAIPPDAARDARARELAKTAHTWPVVTLRKPWGRFKVGDRFRQTPNGYRCNAVACSCPDYAEWGNICKHVRAVVLLEQRGPIRPVRQRFADLFPSCPCGEISENRDGLCYQCASEREYQRRRAAQAAARVNGG